METLITKHPEFEKEGQRNLELFEGTILNAREMFDAGGEAAQAILQPEINRLRESNAELIELLKRHKETFLSLHHEGRSWAIRKIERINKALELAEGPNK